MGVECRELRAFEQAGEVGEGLVGLRRHVVVMARGMPGHRGGPRDRQRGIRQAHRAREARSGGAVLAGVLPGTDLARVFQRAAGLRRAQRVDLQQAARPVVADCGGGGIVVDAARGKAARAAVAEQPVAFLVALARVDRVEVIPDPLQVAFGASRDVRSQQGVGMFAGGFDATEAGFVDLDRDEAPATAGRPSQVVIAPGRDFGVTRETGEALLDAGVDVMTSGNHIWDKKEALAYIGTESRLIRPANYP